MSRRFVPIVLALALVLSACTSAGQPNSYDDQDSRAERQFKESCEESLSGEDANPPSFCQCAFYTVAAELTFLEFLDLDDKLKDDPEALSLEERRLFESVSLPCEFTAADINKTTVTS